jgi:hypothetical protein
MILSAIEGGSNMPKGGPATQEGKDVVKWNATRHGISSPKPVVPGLEKQEDWESHLEGIMENLSPLDTWATSKKERKA